MNEKDLLKILKALANKRRVEILRFLKKRKTASVGNIANTIKLSFTSTSKHLNILYIAGIIEREQRSLQIFYRLSIDLPTTISRLITTF